MSPTQLLVGGLMVACLSLGLGWRLAVRRERRLAVLISQSPFPLAMFTSPRFGMRLVIANQAWMTLHGHARRWETAVGESHYVTNPIVTDRATWMEKHRLTSATGQRFSSREDSLAKVPLFWDLFRVDARTGHIAMGALSLTDEPVEALRRMAGTNPGSLPGSVTPATAQELQLATSGIEDTQQLRQLLNRRSYAGGLSHDH